MTTPTPVLPVLEAQNLTIAYAGRTAIDGLDLTITQGQITTFVGANGSGKSTLLKAPGRILRPAAGQVVLEGGPITDLPTKEVARLAMEPQSPGAWARPSALQGQSPAPRSGSPEASGHRPSVKSVFPGPSFVAFSVAASISRA